MVVGPPPERMNGPTTEHLSSLGPYRLLSPVHPRSDVRVLGTRHDDPVGTARWLDCRCAIQGLGTVEKCAEEAAIATRVRHPNLRPLVEVFSVLHPPREGLVCDFLVGAYERVPAVSMPRMLRSAGPAPVPIAVAIAAGLLEALQAVHAHRDEQGNPLLFRVLSPLEVQLGLDGRALLTDLAGLRPRLDGRDRALAPANLRGYYLYDSPERHLGRPRTVRDDLWSIAMILWTWISGAPVFHRQSEAISLHHLMTGSRLLFAELGPGLPPALLLVLERALHRDPAERHASARELLADLRAAAPCATAEEVAAWALARGASQLEEYESGHARGAPTRDPDDGESIGYRATPQAHPSPFLHDPRRPVAAPVSLRERWRRWWSPRRG
jgi:serine/threonine-protein kinase